MLVLGGEVHCLYPLVSKKDRTKVLLCTDYHKLRAEVYHRTSARFLNSPLTYNVRFTFLSDQSICRVIGGLLEFMLV